MNPRALAVVAVLLPNETRVEAKSRATETGNDLHRECNATGPMFYNCGGYVAGVIDTTMDLQAHGTGLGVCLDKNATRGQLVDTVKKHLAEHPGERHYSAANIVARAAQNAFPCPKPAPE